MNEQARLVVGPGKLRELFFIMNESVFILSIDVVDPDTPLTHVQYIAKICVNINFHEAMYVCIL